MVYQEALRYLESFINYERFPAWHYKESLKLERVNKFLSLIGNPQGSLRCIHVAGTKGKGSTCAFIAYILKEAGFKVGLYTSPHLSDFRERIRILHKTHDARSKAYEFEGMISRPRLAGLVSRLLPAVEVYNKSSEYGPLTFFEVYTALAFLYFKEEKVDFSVLETGLGGRLDATNCVNALVSVITPISYEHTDKLGKTLAKIATEKAGIIKNHNFVISAPQKKEAMQVIQDRCRQAGAKLRIASNIPKRLGKVKLGLIGGHQVINAAGAVAAVEELKRLGICVPYVSLRQGLRNTLWPGRCEIFSRSPLTVLDGAHNAASAKVLVKALRDNFRYKRLILVLGISSDKDIKGVCSHLNTIADKIILTRAYNPRATPPEKLPEYFPGKELFITKDVKEAKQLANKISVKGSLVLVTGSLFVVGEYRNA